MESLTGRVALVTGASRGIGAAVGRQLHAAGARVGLVSRSGDDLGLDGALGVAADVRDHRSIGAAADAVADRFGGIDILVVNAGVGAYGPIGELDPEHLEEMIDVNVKGAIHSVRAALPYLVRSEAADLVTVASEAGRRGLPNEAVYCASKFAQVGLSQALDREFFERNIKVSLVCPGGVETHFALGDGRTAGSDRMSGFSTAEDVAEAVVMAVLPHPRSRIVNIIMRPMNEQT